MNRKAPSPLQDEGALVVPPAFAARGQPLSGGNGADRLSYDGMRPCESDLLMDFY
jgi:hypothetical protein